jgi:putative GTP pyrophosphokinase
MPLTKRAKERILVQFYGAQDNYERLATEIRRLMEEDSAFLADALYTIRHRIKDTERLLQKIDQFNARLRKNATPISPTDFQDRVEDLLGVRVVCLRLSDLAKLQRHLADLEESDKIKITKGPVEKKTFLVRPGDPDTAGDMQYSGYSSVHYVIRLGKAARPSGPLALLKAEVQLRTILEEAWGEIDHKYRYELKRAGTAVPPHVDAGFRDLSLYLQAAARQVEHLCEDVERLKAEPKKPRRKGKGKTGPAYSRVEAPPSPSGTTTAPPPTADNTIPSVIRRVLGFEPSARAVPYLEQRLDEQGYHLGQPFGPSQLESALSESIRRRFTEIYRETMSKPPFQETDGPDRDLDIIPLVNFALFSKSRSAEAAEAGLRASLRRRLSQRGY